MIILKKIYSIFLYRVLPEKCFLKWKINKDLGYRLNLESPKLFTEKIQWLKLNDRKLLLTQCADKYRMRKYVEEKVGSQFLIPLVFFSEEVDSICEENMPDYPVVIKPNHDNGGVFIIGNKNTCDFNDLRIKLKTKLKKNYYYRGKEWEYKNIKPGIVVEKYLQDASGNKMLNDYKVHCFNGEPKYIQTIFDRATEVKENWFNAEWEEQEFWYFSSKKAMIPKPKVLGEMLGVARKLSSEFIYVRVDLYVVDNSIFVGELTFHPYAGFMSLHPSKWDAVLGDMLNLPID